jgi:hypothetical protein
MTQLLISHDPFLSANDTRPWREQGHWPADWIRCAGASAPLVMAFRLVFSTAEAGEARLHVTADERYELFLDGERIGRGPERGDPYNWFYQTHAVQLAAGEHRLSARVWALGELAAEYQMSVQPGFLLAAEGAWGPLLSTGRAPWQARILDGYDFLPPAPCHWRDHRVRIDGQRYPWGAELGLGEQGWQPAERIGPGVGRVIDWSFYRQHRLQPGTLPAQLARPRLAGQVRFAAPAVAWDCLPIAVRAADHDARLGQDWQALVSAPDGSGEILVPAGSRQRVIFDLQDYACVYPEIELSGGAGGRVRLGWAESLRHQPDPYSADKGHRDEIEGKYFAGLADEYVPDGGQRRVFAPLWWQAGRYAELVIESGPQALTVHAVRLVETRYPLEFEGAFSSSDPRLAEVLPLLVRGLQVDAHDAYFDTPYYEEHMYAGDTRLECLTTYVMTRDDRLPRKAIRLFDASRLPSGFTQSRYPCRVTQVIPAWSLWWVGMLHEYAFWRSDPAFVRGFLPGMRATLQAFTAHLGTDGLLGAPEGWNNLDWVSEWDAQAGIPPGGLHGVSGPLNWQLVYTLALAAEVEELLGAREQALYNRRLARKLAGQALAAFWDPRRGLLADDLARTAFSEHSQALALLSDYHLGGLIPADQGSFIALGLLHDDNLARASYHFMHYLFETYRILGAGDAIVARMGWWHTRMVQRGLKTPLERLEPSRSDCHAWSSHPLYHYFATLLGIRPGMPGFASVAITPLLGPLQSAEGRLVHPGGGEISASLRREGQRLTGQISMPEGLPGTLNVNSERIALTAGLNQF